MSFDRDELTAREPQEQRSQSRWIRLNRKYQNVSLLAKVFAAVAITLFVSSAIALAIFAPPTLLFTLPFIGQITTSVLTLIGMALGMAGAVGLGHAIHIGVTEPKKVGPRETDETEKKLEKEEHKKADKKVDQNAKSVATQSYTGVLDKLKEKKLTPTQLEAKTKAQMLFDKAAILYSKLDLDQKLDLKIMGVAPNLDKEELKAFRGYYLYNKSNSTSPEWELYFIENGNITPLPTEPVKTTLNDLKVMKFEDAKEDDMKIVNDNIRALKPLLEQNYLIHKPIQYLIQQDKIAIETEITNSVLDQKDIYAKVKLMEYWAQVAYECERMGNIHSRVAIEVTLSNLSAYTVAGQFLSDTTKSFLKSKKYLDSNPVIPMLDKVKAIYENIKAISLQGELLQNDSVILQQRMDETEEAKQKTQAAIQKNADSIKANKEELVIQNKRKEAALTGLKKLESKSSEEYAAISSVPIHVDPKAELKNTQKMKKLREKQEYQDIFYQPMVYGDSKRIKMEFHTNVYPFYPQHGVQFSYYDKNKEENVTKFLSAKHFTPQIMEMIKEKKDLSTEDRNTILETFRRKCIIKVKKSELDKIQKEVWGDTVPIYSTTSSGSSTTLSSSSTTYGSSSSTSSQVSSASGTSSVPDHHASDQGVDTDPPNPPRISYR